MEIQINKNINCNIIIIDNFYENPNEIRDFALIQEFNQNNIFPGKITKKFANIDVKNKFQEILAPFDFKITDFNLHDDNNGAFHYTIAYDRTYIKKDGHNNWKGIVFLTPNPPLNSGISFYKLKDISHDNDLINENTFQSNLAKDITKWELVDKIGNLFNRLVLFNSKRYHMNDDCFGQNIENGKLFQEFKFSTQL